MCFASVELNDDRGIREPKLRDPAELAEKINKPGTCCACMCILMCVCMCVYVCACVCVCMCARVHISTQKP